MEFSSMILDGAVVGRFNAEISASSTRTLDVSCLGSGPGETGSITVVDFAAGI